MKTHAHAKIQITVEVDCGSGWGGDCDLNQVYDQAKESGKQTLISAISKSRDIRIIGEPRVVGIITEQE